MAFEITEKSLKKIKEVIESKDGIGIKSGVIFGTTFLRIGVAGGGCSGFSYVLEWDNNPVKDDRIFEFSLPGSDEGDHKLKVAIDPKSYLLINGATLDYVEQGLTGGFTFINPNAKSSCGCGQSFHA